MKKKHIILTCALAALVLSASIGGAWSYFTTYAEARGGEPIVLGDETEINERVVEDKKIVTIANKKGSQPVYVRAKALASKQYPLSYKGSGWKKSGEWYYYDASPVAGGETTKELTITIGDMPSKEAAKDGEALTVVVVYETIPAFEFDSKGNPVKASASKNWDTIVDVVE